MALLAAGSQFFKSVPIGSGERHSELLCVRLPVARSTSTPAATLYVLASSAPRPANRLLNPGGYSLQFLPPVSHVYLRPPTHAAAVQLPPPLGSRLLKASASASTRELQLWDAAGDEVALETFHELVFEVRNESYVLDECRLLDAHADGRRGTDAAAVLVANGCAVELGVRVLQPLPHQHPLCRNLSAGAAGPRERLPSTDAAQLCSTCHPCLRVAVSRAALDRRLPPNRSKASRARRLVRIECSFVSYRQPLALDDTVVSEESAAFRRAVQHLGFEACPVRFTLAPTLYRCNELV